MSQKKSLEDVGHPAVHERRHRRTKLIRIRTMSRNLLKCRTKVPTATEEGQVLMVKETVMVTMDLVAVADAVADEVAETVLGERTTAAETAEAVGAAVEVVAVNAVEAAMFVGMADEVAIVVLLAAGDRFSQPEKWSRGHSKVFWSCTRRGMDSCVIPTKITLPKIPIRLCRVPWSTSLG